MKAQQVRDIAPIEWPPAQRSDQAEQIGAPSAHADVDPRVRPWVMGKGLLSVRTNESGALSLLQELSLPAVGRS